MKNINFGEFFRKLVGSRSLKYGSNSVILVAAVIAIAIFVNVLVVMVPDKLSTGPLKLDLTPNKLYSVGDTSKEILGKLQKDVTIYGFFDESTADAQTKQVIELLNQYKKNSHIKIEYVDPDKKPGFIKQLDPDNTKEISKGNFLVMSGKKMRKLDSYDLVDTQFDQESFTPYTTGSKAEQAFTGAIKYVTSDTTPSIYFVQGHQEKTIESDYRQMKDFLERNNFDVKTVNLTTESKVPDNADIVFVAAPKKDFTTDETGKLKKFLDNGGKAVFMFDSLEANPSFTQLESILQNYNVSINYDKVKENDQSHYIPPNRNYDIKPDLQSNTMTSGLDPNIIMSNSRSVNMLKNTKEYITVTSLMKTTAQAVGEQIDKSKGKDLTGPLDLAVAVENNGGAKPSRILVVGNGSFITDNALNVYQGYAANGIYFTLNMLNWLDNKTDDTLIAPKNYDVRRLTINQVQATTVIIAVIIVLPLLIFGLGTFVWMRRRHL